MDSVSRFSRIARAALLGLILLPLAGIASAQDGAPPPAATTPTPSPAISADEAELTVFNRHITTFRAPFLGVSPAKRAERSRLAVNGLLAQEGPGVVGIQKEPQGTLLLIDGQMAIILTAADADQLRGETLDSITKGAAAALQQALDATRESRDSKRLLHSIADALVATLIYVLLIWAVWRLRAWLAQRLSTRLSSEASRLRIANKEMISVERTLMLTRWLTRVLAWVAWLALSYWWISHVFALFPYTRPWAERFDGQLIGIGLDILGGVLGALPELLVAIVIFLVARMFVRFLTPLFDHLEAGHGEVGALNVDTARPTRRLVNTGIWLFAFVMAYPYLPGSGSDAFRGISVLIGLMISLGGSSLLGQAASGLILMYSRTLRVGEYVRVAEYEGTVTDLGTFTTKLRTGLGEELILPNSMVVSTATKNYSRAVKGAGYVVDTTVTIGYDTPWRQVEAMLIEAASRTPGVLAEPPPRVFQTALSDFYPEYRLVCQAIPSAPRPRAEVLTALHANIQDVFNEYGVQIMSPHYLADPVEAKVVAREQWYAAPAVPPEKS